jgi:cytochrome bd ubiquinol oxidase subunit II
VFLQKYKYAGNVMAMPVNTAILIIGVAGVLWGIGSTIFMKSNKGFWFAGPGTVFTVFALFIIAGFNNTAFYPSVYDLQSSLTIQNASSSKFTLTVMSYVSLLIPFVFAYIVYFWRVMNKKKITEQEMHDESHVY